MALVQGEAHFVIQGDIGRKLLRQTKEFSIESLADAIHAAYCGATPFANMPGTAGDVHRRQHVEIARQIFEKGA